MLGDILKKKGERHSEAHVLSQLNHRSFASLATVTVLLIWEWKTDGGRETLKLT